MNNNIHDPEDFVYFVLLSKVINRASNSFTLAYNDLDNGDYVMVKGPNGAPLRIKFTKSRRTIRYPKTNAKLVEAIRNHPWCEGSKNGLSKTHEGVTHYPEAIFKEVKEADDARVSVDATKLRSDAMNVVFDIMKDENAAEDLSLVLGIKGSGSMSHSKLLQYAEMNPQELIDTVKSADFEARALAKKALSLSVLQRSGAVYVVGDIEYGIEFDDVVKEIIKDSNKKELIKRKLGIVPETLEKAKSESKQ